MQGLASVDTERLRLTRWSDVEHGPALARMNADPEVVRYVGGAPLTVEMIERVEVGWRLAREAWGHGYATEGARAAVRVGCDDLGLDELVSFVHPENTRSLAVTARLGMVEEAEVPHPSRAERIRIMRLACSTS
jgi:RimJ/RimL family protein N-acetyltransferase